MTESATKTAPGIAEETETFEEIVFPWNVVVYNDPVNLMSYVSMVFQKVFGYSEEKAEEHMLEVHNEGRSILWTGERECAEHYAQQLQGYQLLSAIEQISG